jgi:hypothetical protein
MTTRELLEKTGDLEWAGRRMMELRTAVLVVNWMQEEGMVDPQIDPLDVARRFTGGPNTAKRKIFEKAAILVLNGRLKKLLKLKL